MNNARFSKAIEFHRSGKITKAVTLYIDLLLTNKSNPQLLFLLGVAYLQLDQYEQALIFLGKSIKLYPDNSISHYNYAVALQSLHRINEAIESYRCAIKLQPDYAEAYSNLGAAFSELKRFDDAIECYNYALELNPNYVDVYYNCGNVLCDLDRLEDALVSYDHAIQLNPNYAEAYNNRGVALRDLGRLEDALVSYDHAIQLNPNYAEAYNNRGVALRELGWFAEALESSDRAIELNLNYAEAYNSRGITLRELGRLEDALLNSYKAIQLKPDIDYLMGNLFQTKIQLCDWQDYQQLHDQLIKNTKEQKRVSTPFIMLALTEDAQVQRQSAEIYAKDNYPVSKFVPISRVLSQHQKIRIGYFSADFHNHATMHLMAELFEHHDKNKFELYGFSFGPYSEDDWRKRVELCFDQFIDVAKKSDVEIALLARDLEIDIAIDLKGFTRDERAGIFALKAAPIQVNYLGYPGTIGSEYMDYIIADPILIPKDNLEFYSEKVVYIPYSYQVNVKNRVISKRNLSRQDAGLPNEAFVFCSFNNNHKITPSTFDSWMRILKSVEGSVLWLFKSNDIAVKNLKKEAELRGVDSERLFFASFIPVEEHLRRIQLADLFLDTLPYNAHTTASDALRVGLPIVTLMGESFASRVAAGLLNTVDLADLITTKRQDYESLAIELANNPEKLQAIKNKLIKNVQTSPLFNSELFTLHLELAYKEMYQRYQNDLPPDHIYIRS